MIFIYKIQQQDYTQITIRPMTRSQVSQKWSDTAAAMCCILYNVNYNGKNCFQKVQDSALQT